jgi:hypothetical protein
MRTEQVVIAFDGKKIAALVAGVPKWEIAWMQVERIGYRTTDAGPWQDDHFLVFRTNTNLPAFYDVSLSWVGAKELEEHVRTLPETRIPPEGALANCTTNRSVTVWPKDKSGEPIDS